MTDKNPHGLVVGHKLYYVPTRVSGASAHCELEIESIGRKWALCGSGWGAKKIDLVTLSADGGKYTSPGRCYLSKNHYEKTVRLNTMWGDIYNLFSNRYSKPDHITEQDMIDITAIMERGK